MKRGKRTFQSWELDPENRGSLKRIDKTTRKKDKETVSADAECGELGELGGAVGLSVDQAEAQTPPAWQASTSQGLLFGNVCLIRDAPQESVTRRKRIRAGGAGT